MLTKLNSDLTVKSWFVVAVVLKLEKYAKLVLGREACCKNSDCFERFLD